MGNRIKRFLLAISLISGCFISVTFLSATVFAQSNAVQVIEPDLDRRDLSDNAIDVENFEIGLFAGVISIEDFSSSTVYGLRAAYHFTEDVFFEATYGTAKGSLTSFEKLSGGSPLIDDEAREYNYYDLSVGWNFLPGEIFIWNKYAFNTQGYLIAGVGNTGFAGDDWFTLTLGAGIRLLLSDAIAWHLDVRDHRFDRDTFGEAQTTHNLETHTGITVFF